MSDQRSAGTRQPIYRVQRALEHAVTIPGMNPVRFFAVLFPLWRVEVTATAYEFTPYQVIDEYLERGIAEGGITSSAGLASFFGLDQVLADRALRFLEAVGHVTRSGDTVSLTPIGYRSVKDGRLYERKESRLKLYFDGYTCSPLPREHYADGVRVLPESAAHEPPHLGPARFQPLYLGTTPYRSAALRQLAAQPDRGAYNLPDELENVESVEHAHAYLPVYLIEATDGRSTRYLAFSKVEGLRDTFIEEICATQPRIHQALAAEDAKTHDELWETWRQWDHLRGLTPERLPNGVMRVTLPTDAFGDKPKLSLARLGSFDTKGRYFLQLWCSDVQLRRMAALERALQIVRSGSNRAPTRVTEQLDQLTAQLEVPPLDTEELRQHATGTGRDRLVQLIDKLRQ